MACITAGEQLAISQ